MTLFQPLQLKIFQKYEAASHCFYTAQLLQRVVLCAMHFIPYHIPFSKMLITFRTELRLMNNLQHRKLGSKGYNLEFKTT